MADQLWMDKQFLIGRRFLMGQSSDDCSLKDSIFGLSYLLWAGCSEIGLDPMGPEDESRAQIVSLVTMLNGIKLDDEVLDECILRVVMHRTSGNKNQSTPLQVLRLRRRMVAFIAAAKITIKAKITTNSAPVEATGKDDDSKLRWKINYLLAQIRQWKETASKLRSSTD